MSNDASGSLEKFEKLKKSIAELDEIDSSSLIEELETISREDTSPETLIAEVPREWFSEESIIDFELDGSELENPAVIEKTSNHQENKKEEKNNKDFRAIIKDLKLPGKIKLAMFGNSLCRSLLIKDKNRVVQEAVLSNAKMRDKEIEDFAKDKNTPSNILRMISNNKAWIKSYGVKRNLVFNPKTPNELGIKWVKFLNKTDLKKVSKSKNLPQVVATTAKKKIQDEEKKRG